MRLKSILAASFAALLALTGCSGSNDTEADAPKEPLSFADAGDADAYFADQYGGGADEHDGNVDVSIESRGTELQDQDRSANAIQDFGEGVEFDYDTLTLSIRAESGSGCGHRYTSDVVDELTGLSTSDGSLVFTEIWDYAEASTPCNY